MCTIRSACSLFPMFSIFKCFIDCKLRQIFELNNREIDRNIRKAKKASDISAFSALVDYHPIMCQKKLFSVRRCQK
jgi:hypothetical protein